MYTHIYIHTYNIIGILILYKVYTLIHHIVFLLVVVVVLRYATANITLLIIIVMNWKNILFLL